MIRRSLVAGVVCVAAQRCSRRSNEDRSAPAGAATGPAAGRRKRGTGRLSPLPQWLGQTRAPAPREDRGVHGRDVCRRGERRSFQFLPDGRILLAETQRPHPDRRQGRQTLGAARGHAVGHVHDRSEPVQRRNPIRGFATNRTIYFTYAVLPAGVDPATQRSPAHVHVASARISADDKRLEGVKDLLDAEGTGGRVIQANDGTLLVETTVPAGLGIISSEWMQPQQLDSLMGKVLRINADGTIPKDNPFVGKAGARPEIYALGFRDPQGMAIHPKTGRLWTSEHGPRGGDEINEVEKGKNYGFPVIGYGRDYNGKPINGDKTVQAGMEQPVYFWTPDIAPAGIAFYTGKMFPGVERQPVRVGARGQVSGASRARRQPRRRRGAAAGRSERAYSRRSTKGPTARCTC